MLAAMIKRLEKYLSKKPANSRNAYEIFSLELYCKTKEQREAALTGGLFGKAEAVDFEKFIKNEFFTTDLNRKSH